MDCIFLGMYKSIGLERNFGKPVSRHHHINAVRRKLVFDIVPDNRVLEHSYQRVQI